MVYLIMGGVALEEEGEYFAPRKIPMDYRIIGLKTHSNKLKELPLYGGTLEIPEDYSLKAVGGDWNYKGGLGSKTGRQKEPKTYKGSLIRHLIYEGGEGPFVAPFMPKKTEASLISCEDYLKLLLEKPLAEDAWAVISSRQKEDLVVAGIAWLREPNSDEELDKINAEYSWAYKILSPDEPQPELVAPWHKSPQIPKKYFKNTTDPHIV